MFCFFDMGQFPALDLYLYFDSRQIYKSLWIQSYIAKIHFDIGYSGAPAKILIFLLLFQFADIPKGLHYTFICE